MKLKRFLLGALPLVLLTACSNDDEPQNNSAFTEADGFVTVNLQLPTQSATRAANDNFDDGAKSEYNVNEGIFVLFKGDDEANAVYCGAYDLQFPKVPTGGNDQNGNVTVSYKRAVKIVNPKWATGANLYGLVLINQSQANIKMEGRISIENIVSPATISGLKIGDNTVDNNTTFSQIAGYISNEKFYDSAAGETANSIFMTNSPLVVNTQGGVTSTPVPETVEMQTLVKLDQTKIKPTEAEALKEAAAGTIYVERAVAKITCSKIMNATSVGDGIESGVEIDGSKLVIKNIEWALGNEEAQSYVVRNVAGINWSLKSDASNNYRMVGAAGMLQNMEIPSLGTLYRPYWCKDLTYNAPKTNPEQLNTMISWNGNQVLYSHENTFDVEHQTYGNTTRVGMWVTFGVNSTDPAKTFYTLNGDRQKIYFDRTLGGQNVTPFVNDVYVDLSQNQAVINAWKAAVTPGEGSGSIDGASLMNYIDVTTAYTDAGVLYIPANGLTWKDNANWVNGNKPDNAVLTALIPALNSTYQYAEYKDGKAFYEIRIKHFGDDLTPWTIATAATTVDEAYPSANRDNNYLGRFGMVRNNWYDIQINNIMKLGDPRDPAIWDTNWSNTPDDNNEQYIALRIAVLSWAKRTQIEDL